MMFSEIKVACEKCNFVVSDYIVVQTCTNDYEPPKTEIMCRPCALKHGLPVEYKDKTIKTIGLFVED